MKIQIEVVENVYRFGELPEGMSATPYGAKTKWIDVEIPEPFDLIPATRIVVEKLLTEGLDNNKQIGTSNYPIIKLVGEKDPEFWKELQKLEWVVFSEDNWLTTDYNCENHHITERYREQQLRRFPKSERDELLLKLNIPHNGLLKQMAPRTHLYNICWKSPSYQSPGFGMHF